MVKFNLTKGSRHYKCGPLRAALNKKKQKAERIKNLIDESKQSDDVNLKKIREEILKSQGIIEKGKGGKKKKSLKRRLIYYFILLGFWGAVLLGGFLVYHFYQLPDISELTKVKRKPSITILDEVGRYIYSVDDLYGEAVDVSGLPPYVWQAVISIEDRRFFKHFGIDPIGIIRAMYYNLRAGDIVQGGSTITQQVAKNIFLSQERSMTRKIQELLLSFWLEHRFSKNQILSLYLNRVSLVGGTYGIGSAARRLYNKSASELSLYEAASIAAMLKAPSRYHPFRHPEASKERTAVVLNAMVEEGYITHEDAKKAVTMGAYKPDREDNNKRYFVDIVLEELSSRLGNINKDIVIHTTMNLDIQNKAEDLVIKTLENEGEKANASQAALLMIEDDGSILAMVGGRDYVKTQFNRATDALRQPGSVFKPFVYLAALENGYEPTSVVMDKPITIDEWSPKNYNNEYLGKVTLRAALAKSLNTVPVRLSYDIGIDEVIDVAKKLGIVDKVRRDFSIALGSSETRLIDLVGAFAAFANEGKSVIPYTVEKISDVDGNVMYRRKAASDFQVVEKEHVEEMNEMLSYVVSEGTGRKAYLGDGLFHAGKTGTSQENRDAWFIGYTNDLICGVWVGNDEYSQSMDGVYGGGMPAKIWKELMGYSIR
jgi:penicillin-binding protein 1A